jgi:hypothetical protein
VWNDPYPVAERGTNILYSVFAERPSTSTRAVLRLRRSRLFTRQVYEPPLQYHYLKRPYELIPLTAAEIRSRVWRRAASYYSVYDIRIKPGIRFSRIRFCCRKPEL